MTKKEAKKIREMIISLRALDCLITDAVANHNQDECTNWFSQQDEVILTLRDMGINIGQTYQEWKALRA
jgi:hypothetical protein